MRANRRNNILPQWHIASQEQTPEAVFVNRRAVLKQMAIAGGIGLGFAGPAGAVNAASVSSCISGQGYPASRNMAYRLDRPLTPESHSSIHNNFFEFGSHKQIAPAAQALDLCDWTVRIDGLVEQPRDIDINALVKLMALEERLYRHRCVEAWSMTVPWTGFPLARLSQLVTPLSSARFIRFESHYDAEIMTSNSFFSSYPWPYIEAITIEEAGNELAFIATGIYGKPLAKQFGAPIRLVLPWKYGFKSIKSIRRITFTDQRPTSFWQEVQAEEYGFWANVNPDIPHRRWSQATERVLHTAEYVPTLIYNGYGAQVAHLYSEMPPDDLYY